MNATSINIFQINMMVVKQLDEDDNDMENYASKYVCGVHEMRKLESNFLSCKSWLRGTL